MSSNDAARIARGGQPEPWAATFTHPLHGELTFTATMPTVMALMAHSVAIDNLLAELAPTSEARMRTMVLAAALAGLAQTPQHGPGKSLMVELPCVGEDRVEEDSGHVTVERRFYDAAAETSVDFLTEVWGSYAQWRAGILEELDAVKGSLGETSGHASDTPSVAPTGSPSTTPA